MDILYFSFGVHLVRLFVDDESLPERCEAFNFQANRFTLREDLELGVFHSHDAISLSKDDFDERLQAKRAAYQNEKQMRILAGS
ncbi:hypothetical protein ACG74X_17440 [Marivita sp. S0852]|uniref:hypothetical protein n=1 Tax=Marivita sp. S0852 TaxID=3373893 RepID=UPI003982AB01